MFRAVPMSRVKLLFLASEAQDAALLLARHGIFGPALDKVDNFPGSPGDEYREIYLEAEARLAKISDSCGHLEMAPVPVDAIAPNLRELKGINGRLKELWLKCSACADEGQKIDEDLKHLAALRETFGRLKALKVDISRLLKPSSLLDARIGQIPVTNVKRLREALALAGYLLTEFDQYEEQVFAVVAGPRAGGELGDLLSQAGWRELAIPEELQTHPEAASRYLEQEAQRLQYAEKTYCNLKEQSLGEQVGWLSEARLMLALARPMAETALDSLRGQGQLVSLSGWVPKSALSKLNVALEERFYGRYQMTSREPDAQEHKHIPSLLKYPFWLRPFVPLVKSYGVPRYGEFDPSLLFALTYIFLFGAMFGDVGHGAVIMLLSAFLRGKLNWLRVVGMAAGAASILFGFLYGSIFGYEELIHPLWQSPLHNAAQMLVLAVYGGVGFICATLLINAYNRVISGHIVEALFDSTGLIGLVFYLAMVFGLKNVFTGHAFGTLFAILAIVSILAIATFKWLESSAGVGERALVTFIETLETGINLFANTLSFLRVAAFSLNHVALALAIFTLANGMSGAGHWLTVFLGNVVIIVLEGGIVAIQALRLMYYEGFSRFFNGDGVEFMPLRLAQASKES